MKIGHFRGNRRESRRGNRWGLFQWWLCLCAGVIVICLTAGCSGTPTEGSDGTPKVMKAGVRGGRNRQNLPPASP